MYTCPHCAKVLLMPVRGGKIGRRKQPDGGELFVWEEHLKCPCCGDRILRETELERFPAQEVQDVQHL